MLEVEVTEQFERWFEDLDESSAEQVANAIDVVVAAGLALDPVKASRMLLWYDGMATCGSDPHDRRGLAGVLSVEGLRELLLWRQEVLRYLDSPRFSARLAELDPATAARALAAVERLRRKLWGARTHFSLEAYPKSHEQRASVGKPTAKLSVRREEALRTRFGLGGPPAPPFTDSIKHALQEILELVGLREGELADSASGLRELTIKVRSSSIRVIYGIDVARQRILVLLGEPLDRAYYGDSVRFAERRWDEYCQSDHKSKVDPSNP